MIEIWAKIGAERGFDNSAPGEFEPKGGGSRRLLNP